VNTTITYAAMDTHKKAHTVTWLDPQTGETELFEVPNNAKAIKKMVKRLQRKAPSRIKFCYEAGVCGFTLKRQLEALGSDCMVIAPSLVPRKPGDRIKTDRRDARKLLGQFVAGQLTEVHAPNPEQEAAREITRCRDAAKDDLTKTRHRLVKFLTRHGYIYTQGDHWTQKHRQWMRSLTFDYADLRTVFDSYLMELEHREQRVATLTKEVEVLAERPEYKEIVGLLCCFHGIKTLTAMTLVAELFEFGRFDSPRKLMAYLGLVPSLDSSGERHRPGSITKAGNKRVRRAMVQTAWHYRHGPRVGKLLKKRRDGRPQWAIDIADRALQRLCKRYRRLIARGKRSQKAVVAIARELAGFLWALFREYQRRTSEAVTC
jgi:transposase